MSAVAQLPRPAQGNELEARLVGAALSLGIELSTFEALGIAAEDFTVELHRKAWLIARTKATKRLPVSGATVASAGRGGNWFTAVEAAKVEELDQLNLLRREEFLQVAADFRLACHKARTIAALEGELRALRSETFNPGRVAGNLEAIASGLQRDTAPDEDASGDVIELLNDWDTNEKAGKSRLLPTRIAVIDAEYGGLPPGLTVFAAAPGVGKTALLDSMIRAQLEADPELHLGFFGLEDGTAHVARRWMAQDTGMLLRDVGWKQRTAEQREASERAAERFHPLLSRLHVYRHDTITASELVARIASMRMKHRIAAAYVDNLTEVNFANQSRRPEWQEKEHQAIAELGRVLRNYGLRESLPIGLISHTIGALKVGDIPTPQDLAGGQALGRRARLFMGMHTKGNAIRITVNKANELGASGITLELVRFATAGLIDPTQGEKVNLQAERESEKKSKLAEQVAVRDAINAQRKAKRDAEKAAADALKAKDETPAQASLLPGAP